MINLCLCINTILIVNSLVGIDMKAYANWSSCLIYSLLDARCRLVGLRLCVNMILIENSLAGIDMKAYALFSWSICLIYFPT